MRKECSCNMRTVGMAAHERGHVPYQSKRFAKIFDSKVLLSAKKKTQIFFGIMPYTNMGSTTKNRKIFFAHFGCHCKNFAYY